MSTRLFYLSNLRFLSSQESTKTLRRRYLLDLQKEHIRFKQYCQNLTPPNVSASRLLGSKCLQHKTNRAPALTLQLRYQKCLDAHGGGGGGGAAPLGSGGSAGSAASDASRASLGQALKSFVGSLTGRRASWINLNRLHKREVISFYQSTYFTWLYKKIFYFIPLVSNIFLLIFSSSSTSARRERSCIIATYAALYFVISFLTSHNVSNSIGLLHEIFSVNLKINLRHFAADIRTNFYFGGVFEKRFGSLKQSLPAMYTFIFVSLYKDMKRFSMNCWQWKIADIYFGFYQTRQKNNSECFLLINDY